MESQPTAKSQLFQAEASENVVDAYKINLHSGGNQFDSVNADVTVTLTRKEYDENDPTWISLTIADEYMGIPCGNDLHYNYHDSIVSKDKEVKFVCKGPFRYPYLVLLVDGMWKDQKTIEAYTLNIESSIPATIKKIEQGGRRDNDLQGILSDVVASRCLVRQPTHQAVVQMYEGLRHSYKVVDYGDPKLSLYGIIIFVTQCTSQIVEAIEFDNLSDFTILEYPDGTTSVPVQLLCAYQRIILKRKNMGEDPFSFKSQWKTGRTIKVVPGGAGGRGDIGQNYLTPEQWAIAKPPKVKAEKGQKQIVKGAVKTKSNNLALPSTKGTKEKAASPASRSGVRKPSVSPQRKLSNTKPTMSKQNFKKGA